MFDSLKQAVSSRKAAALPVALLLALGGAAAGVFWQASTVLRESGREVAAESEIPFALVRTAEGSPASRAALEWISTPAVFTDAAEADAAIYIAGPTGIFDYDVEGSLRKHYRAGLELPPAPTTSLAIGLSLSKTGRSLYAATAGEGLLILDGLERAALAGQKSGSSPAFQQLRAQDPAYRDLTVVLPLLTGRVVLGTQRKGVLIYDGNRLAALHASLADLRVTALAGDESSLWIGTLDEGLLHWHAGRLERFGEKDGLPDRQVLSLALDGSRVFAGTPLGVAEFRDGRFERELAPGFFANTLLIRERNLLVGTLDEGVVEIPLEATRRRGPRPEGNSELDAVEVRRLIEVGDSPYALASDGLYRLDAQGGEPRQVLELATAVLADRNISALNVDSAGRLWAGYFDRGLDIIEPSLARARHIEDEHVFCVNRIVESEPKRLTAVATANGLAMFDSAGELQHVLGRDEGLIANHVTDVWFGATGMIAATPAGLTFLDASGSRSLYAFHGLINNHVYTLAAAGERLLAGTLGGLSVLDAGVVRANYTTGNSELKHNWITAIVAFDRDWFVGTYGAGILRLDEIGRWHAFADAAGPLEINPNAMAASADRVFAGTLGEGLYVYERTSGRWRAITQGLPSRNVTALELSGGYLYVGTDNGLVRVAESGI